jgi:RNA polymerase sigma-70 factor (ECF subfamily)
MRTVVIMKDVEGFSNEEIAQTLGLSVPAVKSRLHRGRLVLRDALSGYFRKYSQPEGVGV